MWWEVFAGSKNDQLELRKEGGPSKERNPAVPIQQRIRNLVQDAHTPIY
jgi:hypothetical protein